MTEFRIDTCAACDLEWYSKSAITHVLSIDTPGRPTPTPTWFRGTHRHVFFSDVESDEEALKYGAKAPTESDVRAILDFGIEISRIAQHETVCLLVHCTAGVSRSTAAAYVLHAQALGTGREAEALKRVLDSNDRAFPNLLVVTLADRILRREERMVAALRLLRRTNSSSET